MNGRKDSAFSTAVVSSADFAFDQAVCRIDTLLVGLNKFSQDHQNVHSELKSMMVLSIFWCIKAARTSHRAVYQAGVAAMMSSIKAEVKCLRYSVCRNHHAVSNQT